MDKKERCPSCGTKHSEWDPDEGGSRSAYEATARVCFGCRHIEQFSASKQEEAKKDPLISRGLKIFLRKRDRTR